MNRKRKKKLKREFKKWIILLVSQIIFTLIAAAISSFLDRPVSFYNPHDDALEVMKVETKQD